MITGTARTLAKEAEMLAKGIKLLEAITDDHTEPWERCRHCLAVESIDQREEMALIRVVLAKLKDSPPPFDTAQARAALKAWDATWGPENTSERGISGVGNRLYRELASALAALQPLPVVPERTEDRDDLDDDETAANLMQPLPDPVGPAVQEKKESINDAIRRILHDGGTPFQTEQKLTIYVRRTVNDAMEDTFLSVQQQSASTIQGLQDDQQDWRKGVAFIASALGDTDTNLSCVRIAEIALEQRAKLESAEADLARLREVGKEAVDIATRLKTWDMLGATGDGPYVRERLDKIISLLAPPLTGHTETT